MPPTADSTVNPGPHNRMELWLSLYLTAPLDCQRKPQGGQGEAGSKTSGQVLDYSALLLSHSCGELELFLPVFILLWTCPFRGNSVPPEIPGMTLAPRRERDRFLLEVWGWEGEERCREGSGDRTKRASTRTRTHTFWNPLGSRTYNVPIPGEVQFLFGSASVSRIRWYALTCGSLHSASFSWDYVGQARC